MVRLMQLDLTALRNALFSLERGLVRYRPVIEDFSRDAQALLGRLAPLGDT